MDIPSQIAQAKEQAQRGAADLLKTFSFVPDDKLAWSPSATSRSALWIVGHCAEANRAFARGIRGEELGAPADPAAFERMVWEAGRETATREDAVRKIEETVAEIQAALDALTPERAAGMVDFPFGPMPMLFWITFGGLHMEGHARQIDYLQTIWGDLQNHAM